MILGLIALRKLTMKFTFVGNPTLSVAACLQDKHAIGKVLLLFAYPLSQRLNKAGIKLSDCLKYH